MSGDSVFVRAGTYVEALTLAGKDLTLEGEREPNSTILTANGAGRILDIGAGVTAATVILRFHFVNGRPPPQSPPQHDAP